MSSRPKEERRSGEMPYVSLMDWTEKEDSTERNFSTAESVSTSMAYRLPIVIGSVI